MARFKCYSHHQLKMLSNTKQNKKNVVRVGHPQTKLSGSAHATCTVNAILNIEYLMQNNRNSGGYM